MANKRYVWTRTDMKAWLAQAWKVLIPYLIVIIPVLIGQIPKDWAYATAAVYLLNRVWDALRRWYSEV